MLIISNAPNKGLKIKMKLMCTLSEVSFYLENIKYTFIFLLFYNFNRLQYSFVSEIGYVMLFMHQEDDEDVRFEVSYFFIVEKFFGYHMTCSISPHTR